MGLVSQDHALFGTSIKENILFGKPDASIDEIYAAAITANAHNFIRELPEEYETKVCPSQKHSANHNSLPPILFMVALFAILADWRARSIAIRWPKAANCHCKGSHQEPCYTSA